MIKKLSSVSNYKLYSILSVRLDLYYILLIIPFIPASWMKLYHASKLIFLYFFFSFSSSFVLMLLPIFLVQVAEEIGTEVKYQKTFLEELVHNFFLFFFSVLNGGIVSPSIECCCRRWQRKMIDICRVHLFLYQCCSLWQFLWD